MNDSSVLSHFLFFLLSVKTVCRVLYCDNYILPGARIKQGMKNTNTTDIRSPRSSLWNGDYARNRLRTVAKKAQYHLPVDCRARMASWISSCPYERDGLVDWHSLAVFLNTMQYSCFMGGSSSLPYLLRSLVQLCWTLIIILLSSPRGKFRTSFTSAVYLPLLRTSPISTANLPPVSNASKQRCKQSMRNLRNCS